MFYKRKLGKITLFLEAYYLPYIEGELVYLIEDIESYGVDNVGITPGDLYLVVMGNRLLTLKSTWFERNFIPIGE